MLLDLDCQVGLYSGVLSIRPGLQVQKVQPGIVSSPTPARSSCFMYIEHESTSCTVTLISYISKKMQGWHTKHYANKVEIIIISMKVYLYKSPIPTVILLAQGALYYENLYAYSPSVFISSLPCLYTLWCDTPSLPVDPPIIGKVDYTKLCHFQLFATGIPKVSQFSHLSVSSLGFSCVHIQTNFQVWKTLFEAAEARNQLHTGQAVAQQPATSCMWSCTLQVVLNGYCATTYSHATSFWLLDTTVQILL